MKRLLSSDTLTGAAGSKVKRLFNSLKMGEGLSLDFFLQHGWFVALIMAIVLGTMGLRNKYRSRMTTITQLTKELREAESDKLREKQEYMTLIRQTKMDELVRENGLGLVHQEQPPYEIDDPEKDN